MDTCLAFLLIILQVLLVQSEQISLKLIGGSTDLEGNVYVKRGSDWGLVCDDDWSIEDGNVVCRQLGLGKAKKITTYNRFKAGVTEKIFLDDVKCQGHEANLGACKHREWLTSNCNAGEAAGVVCEGKTTPEESVLLEIVAKTNDDELPAAPEAIAVDTEDDELPAPAIHLVIDSEAHTTSRTTEREEPERDASAGYSQRTRDILARAREILSGRGVIHSEPEPEDHNSRESYGAAPIQPDDGLSALRLNQLSIDESLSQASAALQGLSGSFEVEQHEAPREVSDDEIRKIDKVMKEMIYKSDEPKMPPAKPYHVEVVGGRRSNEGYVQVTLDNGQKGAICSDNWGIYEAMVVCRQTGNNQAEKSTLIDYYGARTEDKVLYEVNCDGHERSIADCEYKLSDRHGVKCSKPMNVAGVVCTSAKLPDLMPNIWALQSSLRIEEKPLYSLQCAMEENCLSSSARTAQLSPPSYGSSFGGYGGFGFGGFSSGPSRKLLRFSSNIFNNGTADFRPHQQRNNWEWHSCHQHYHSMGAFSHYDILDVHGNRVAEGHKASFCLEDVECNFPHRKKYSCRGFADQGISVGCADVYRSDIDCQWIDITDLNPGAFVFKLNVNPKLEVPELSFDNNAAVCELTYNGYSAKLSNCVLSRG